MNRRIRKNVKKIISILLIVAIFMLSSGRSVISGLGTSVFGEINQISDETEPEYDAKKHVLKYDNDRVTLNGSSKDFGVTIASDIIYYTTFTVKTDGDIWFNYRGDTGRLFIGAKEYCVTGVENETWEQVKAVAKNGVSVTIKSSSDKVSVWFNGTKIVKDAKLKNVDCAGQPKISWASEEAEFTGIKVWINKEDDVDDTKKDEAVDSKEPKYDASIHKMWYDEKNIQLAPESAKDFEIKFNADDTYYSTFTLKTEGDVYIDFRGNTGRVYIGEKQYCIIGVENQSWVQEQGLAKAEDGVRVTVQSSGKKVSVWINGKKVVDDATLVNADQQGNLKVTWTTKDTTFTNVQIWADKSVDTYKEPWQDPAAADVNEPKYDKSIHDLKYSKEKIEIEKESTCSFETTIASGNTYYTQYTLKTQGDFYYNFRGDVGRILIGATQYCILGVEEVEWVQTKGMAQGNTGVRVTIASEGDLISVWFNGTKIADREKLSTTGLLGLPAVTWTTEKVTLENVKVWTAKGQNEKVTVEGSDEPIYNKKTDFKYDVYAVKGGKYKNGIITLEKESNAIFLSELPYNASYYMTMMIKTENAINIQSRHKEEIFNMSKLGYSATSIGTAWHDKKISTLANGTRITLYSTKNNLTVWIDGEKITSGTYANKGAAAQPGIGWSFDSTVEISDICIWTTKEYKSDEPVYNKKTDVLHDFSYVGSVKIKNNKAIIKPLANATMSTDFDSDTEYYMSLNIKTENSVNVMYRNPDGFVCIGQDGYVSSGTKGTWVQRMFYKLSTGMRVTLYSSPTHITIWADGEKIVDTTYKNEGEACPAIAWSFEKQVEVSDVKLWTSKQDKKIIQGTIENTSEERLGSKNTYQVGLQADKSDEYLKEQINTGKYNMTSDYNKTAVSVNEVVAEATTLSEIDILPVIYGSILVVVLTISLTIWTIILYKKENE